jgi:hypothetical protein
MFSNLCRGPVAHRAVVLVADAWPQSHRCVRHWDWGRLSWGRIFPVGACLDGHSRRLGFISMRQVGFEPIDPWNWLGASLVIFYFGSYPVAWCILGFGMFLSFFSFTPTYLCCMPVWRIDLTCPKEHNPMPFLSHDWWFFGWIFRHVSQSVGCRMHLLQLKCLAKWTSMRHVSEQYSWRTVATRMPISIMKKPGLSWPIWTIF